MMDPNISLHARSELFFHDSINGMVGGNRTEHHGWLWLAKADRSGVGASQWLVFLQLGPQRCAAYDAFGCWYL